MCASRVYKNIYSHKKEHDSCTANVSQTCRTRKYYSSTKQSTFTQNRKYLVSRFRIICLHISAGHLNCNIWFSLQFSSHVMPTYRSAFAYSIRGLFVYRGARLTRTKGSFKGLTVITCFLSGSFTSMIKLLTYIYKCVSTLSYPHYLKYEIKLHVFLFRFANFCVFRKK